MNTNITQTELDTFIKVDDFLRKISKDLLVHLKDNFANFSYLQDLNNDSIQVRYSANIYDVTFFLFDSHYSPDILSITSPLTSLVNDKWKEVVDIDVKQKLKIMCELRMKSLEERIQLEADIIETYKKELENLNS